MDFIKHSPILSKGCTNTVPSRTGSTIQSVKTNLKGIFNSQKKRHFERCSPKSYEKKIKLDKCISSANISNVDLFEDTLDNLNITEIYINNSDKHSNVNSIQNKRLPNGESENTELDLIEDDFYQPFNTQIINQIDTFIESETASFNELEKAHGSKNEIGCSKSAENNVSLSPTNSDVHIQNRSLLFQDQKVTTTYKKEVDDLFEQIEQSICAFGTDNLDHTVPDNILDVFFADDLINPSENVDLNPQLIEGKLHDKVNENLANIDWKENSFFNAANCSFGTVIKQALLNNATKSIQPHIGNFVDSSLNISICDPKVKFKKLGNFYDLPNTVKDLIKQYKGIDKLYDWQKECLEQAICNRKNLIYSLPTSGGKTLVAEILMLREVMCFKKNAIFILPYVAIVQEKVWDFSPFGVALDFLIEEYASSKGTYPPRKRRRKRSVYIATIEKALGLINSLIETGRLQEIGLVVVDELHLVGEEGRGGILEALLTKLMFLHANIQIIGMSATIGNIEDICQFLKAGVYTKDFRPVDLQEYVKCGTEIAKVNWKYASEEDLLVDVKKLDYKYSEAESKLDPDMISELALKLVPKDSCLIFCPTKKNCENVINFLAKIAKPNLKNYKKLEKEQLLRALKTEAGEICSILKLSVPFGLAYHHSGLTSDERRLLEDAYRAGIISVICCTSTLAAGVNLPARRVILRSPYIGKDFITLSKYKQMAGRAGRAGLGETGESIIVTQSVDMPKVKKLLMSPMNQALSHLHISDGKGLRHLLLSCISLGIANTRLQLQNVTKATLMAVQIEKLNVNPKKITDTVIKNLFKLGALEDGAAKGKENPQLFNISVKMDTSLTSLAHTQKTNASKETISKKPKKTVVLTSNTKLVVSNLGFAAIKGGLDLSRAHQLYDDLYEAQKSLVLLNCLHLLYLVTPYEIAEQIKPNMLVYYEVLTHLNDKELQTARILGFDEAIINKMVTGHVSKHISEKVINRFYVTFMIYDLWKEKPVFEVSEKFQISRGIVQNLMTISATFASNVVNFCDQLEEFWPFSYLLKGMSQRLSHCCVRELLPLMELPAVKQSRAKQLFNAGYKNLQSIAKATVDELQEHIEFMSRKVASQLIAASKMLLLEKVENLREEAEDVLDGVDNPKQRLQTSTNP